MEEFISHFTPISWIHLAASFSSLISGTYVILNLKGTKIHKQVGYVYAVSMTIVIITAFMIYRLFGGFGIFHAFAILSAVALYGGMYPMFKKNRTTKDLKQHAEVMGWSVVGLYCATISEVCSRMRFDYAMIVLGLGCGITCFLGSRIIKKSLVRFAE